MTTLTTHARNELIDGIRAGEFALGDALPPTPELAPRLGCSPATVEKVLTDLAREGVVQRIRRRGTIVVGPPAVGEVLLLLSSDPHLSALLADPIYSQLRAAGLAVQLLPHLAQPELLAQQVDQISQGRREPLGLVALEPCPPSYPGGERLWKSFSRFAGRVVFSLSESTAAPGSHLICPDHRRSARQVLEHLLELGHRRIAVSFVPDGHSYVWETAEYCRSLLQIRGAQFVPVGYFGGPSDEAARAVAAAGATALWTLHDHEAMLASARLERLGLRVPEDVSIVGRNDTPWSTQCPAPLTTVSLNPPAVAQAVAAALKQAMHDPQLLTPGPTLVPTELIVRHSTRPPRP